MAYLGNSDLGRSLQVGGQSMNPIYADMQEDFEHRIGSGNSYKPNSLLASLVLRS